MKPIVWLAIPFCLATVFSCQSLKEQWAFSNFGRVTRDSSGEIVGLVGSSESLDDLRFVKDFPKLKTLDISGSRITDYTSLASLDQLQSVSIFKMKSTDISFIGDVHPLKFLYLSKTKVDSLEPLGNLTDLTEVSFISCNLPSLAPLGKLKKLKHLQLLLCENITDITPLGKLTQLETLEIDRADRITDITVLGNLVNLKSLMIDSSGYTKIRPLAKCTQLKSLILGSSKGYSFDDLRVLLKALPDLKELDGLGSHRAKFLVAQLRPELSSGFYLNPENAKRFEDEEGNWIKDKNGADL